MAGAAYRHTVTVDEDEGKGVAVLRTVSGTPRGRVVAERPYDRRLQRLDLVLDLVGPIPVESSQVRLVTQV